MRYMNEKEAKRTWCPETRVVERWPNGDVTQSRNRVAVVDDTGALLHDITPHGCTCFGSACQMWNWAPIEERKRHGDPDLGYCGLKNSTGASS